MRKATFLELCELPSPTLKRRNTKMRAAMTVEKRVAIALWKLAMPDCYHSVRNQFGVGKSTVGAAVIQVANAIIDILLSRVVTLGNVQDIVDGFAAMGFPNCGGAIDGTHIPILTPDHLANHYVNRQGYFSMVLQALVDHKGRFTNINVGWPGKVYDARIFRNSGLFKQLQEGTYFSDHKITIGDVEMPIVILGDPAYPLLPWLMKPFTGSLDSSKEQFNYSLRKCRMVVECAFGCLKARWCCLLTRSDLSATILRKLQSIGYLPDNTILATMDVEALYTNIPHKDGLQAVKNTIPDNVTANLVAELCDFVLTHNYFTFGDNVYLQISGTAMGTRMAPQYANIFMTDLEQRFLSSRPLTPLLYLSYIDDIFIIWTHGKEALEEFHHDFNNFHPTINLSLVQSTQEIHFLDTTMLINDGHINTTLYQKPTDRYSYLHASSFHPDHTTRSIVYSQALRYNRICSNPSDRDRHLQDLYQAFLQLQYPPVEVKKQIDRARRVPRSHLLQDRPNKENNRTPLAVTFSPQLKPLQRIIKDLQPILKDDPTLSHKSWETGQSLPTDSPPT
ncbi:uncharacterized protein LOC141998984 [Natator depressus]|uniref:uncharacterized protein LOC141998984 n=1 Tax=Natator depressus TaxID=27790 RepID=UPI003EBB7050